MIPEDVIDKIVHVPTEGEATEELIEELTENDFMITNFSKGGVFYTLLRICVHVGIQLKELAVELINSAFMKHCPDEWVEIRAADYSKSRDEGTKTEGYITITRADCTYTAKIVKGHPFRTQPDAYGEYLRYYALEDTVLPAGENVTKVKVQAEYVGDNYNVPQDMIVHSIVHIEGDATVSNEADWITTKGQEKESIEKLRSRCINSRALSSIRTTDQKIKSTVEEIAGIAVSRIDSQHPRGQGTVDIIITGYDGVASEELLERVRKAIQPLEGCYGDYLVKSSVTVTMPVELDIYIEKGITTDGIEEKVKLLIKNMFSVKNRKELNVFYRDSLIGLVANNVPQFCRCNIVSPASDKHENTDCVIIPRDIVVNVYNIE